MCNYINASRQYMFFIHSELKKIFLQRSTNISQFGPEDSLYFIVYISVLEYILPVCVSLYWLWAYWYLVLYILDVMYGYL